MKRWRLLIILMMMLMVVPAWSEGPTRIERKTVSGMTILLEKNQSDIAEVTLLLKSGSGLDGPKKGIAELMNTLVYLKLETSPNELGEVNVLTLPDYTQIRVRTTAENVGDVLREIKELLTYPLYSYDVIADLKQLLGSEIKGMNAFMKTYAEFNRNFYGPEHPYSDQLDPDVMNNITGHDVYRWYRQTYQPGNAILSISGGVKQNIKSLGKFFSDMLSESVDRRLMIKPVILDQDRTIEQEDPNGRIASFCMGFSAPRIQDPEYPAFRIIAFYLEEYQHYFEEVRVKNGLIYTASVFYSYLERPQAPNIVFLTLTDPDNLPLVETKTKDIVNDLIKNGMEQSLITKVAEAIEADGKAKRIAGRGTAHRNAMSYYLQNQLVYDENLWPKLKQVTTNDIKKAAAQYLSHYVRVASIPKTKAENF